MPSRKELLFGIQYADLVASAEDVVILLDCIVLFFDFLGTSLRPLPINK